MKKSYIPPLSQTDKLCLIALAGVFLTAHLIIWAMDSAAYRAAERDETPLVVAGEILSPPVKEAGELIALELVMALPEQQDEEWDEEWYNEDVPLPRDLQRALWDACMEHGVPLNLVLGLIEVESDFDLEEDNGVSYGLMQINRRYYPADLTPAENIRVGVAHLARQIERCGGDIQAALTAYNAGRDTGDRRYARRVLDASEKWGCG